MAELRVKRRLVLTEACPTYVRPEVLSPVNTKEAAFEAVSVASPFPMLLAVPMSARVVTETNLAVVMLKVITPVFVLSPFMTKPLVTLRVTFNLPAPAPSVKLPLQTTPLLATRVAAVAELFVIVPLPSTVWTVWVVPLRSRMAPVRTRRFIAPPPMTADEPIFTVPSRMLMVPAPVPALMALRAKVPRPLFVKPPVVLLVIGVLRFRTSVEPLTRKIKAPAPPVVIPVPPLMVAVPPVCRIPPSFPTPPVFTVRVWPEAKVRSNVVSFRDVAVTEV